LKEADKLQNGFFIINTLDNGKQNNFNRNSKENSEEPLKMNDHPASDSLIE
jgi:hypothetical protein